MAKDAQKLYGFRSRAFPPDTFEVVRFTGEEGLSKLYRFTVTLVSEKDDLDLSAMVQNPARLTIRFEEGELPFGGILAAFEQRQQFGGMTFYQAVLVPRLWWLTLTVHNQIFLDQSLPEFLAAVLEDGGLKPGADFEVRCAKSYPKREYVCQYGETHYDFLARWMERDGLYYFFEQGEQGEKLVITDLSAAHRPMAEGSRLAYLPPSGLDWPAAKVGVKRLSLAQRPLPAKVRLMDYNYRQPDRKLSAEQDVAAHGRGEFTAYGEHFATANEGRELAKVRAEALLCREKTFHGLSTAPYVRSGYVFTLTDHFRDDCNTDYLTVAAHHEGGQEGYLAAGLGLPLEVESERPYYRNTFEAIPARTQFRSEQTTPKPRFRGVMTGFIDAAGSDRYAELDDQGRYKIRLPFDVSGRGGAKASAYVRMIQPYGGAGHGLHFPLHKGTEVLLTCVDGDPDRPIIQACVPNPDTPSQVNDQSKTACRLTTGGGNKLHFENRAGSERMIMSSPTEGSWMRLGQPNDPPSIIEEAPDQIGWKINTNGVFAVRAGLYNQLLLGDNFSWVGGNYMKVIVLESCEMHGLHNKSGISGKQEINLITWRAMLAAQRALGEKVCLNASNIKLAGQLTEMKAAKTEMETVKATMEGQKNKLAMAKQQIEELKSQMEGEVNRLSQLQSNLVQVVVGLEGQQTELTQARQRLTTTTSDLAGQKSTLEQQKTQLQANKTDLTAQITELSTLADRLGASRNRMTANRTIL